MGPPCRRQEQCSRPELCAFPLWAEVWQAVAGVLFSKDAEQQPGTLRPSYLFPAAWVH